MLGILWSRLPLTVSAWVIVGGYSLVRFAFNKINHDYWQRKISTRNSSLLILPQDIQNEILAHLMNLSTEKQLLDLSLTCKNFYARISNHSSWLNARLKKYYVSVSIDGYESADQIDWRVNYETDLLGADRVFSPKLAYFFILKRSDEPTNRLRQRVAISPNLFELKNKNLYVPWMDHNLIKKPETFWQFIKTILICPTWIYPLLASQHRRGKLSMALDRFNSPKISRLFHLLSSVLAYLPFLDSFIYQYCGSFNNILALKSIYELPSLLWNASPLPLSTCLRLVLNLIPSFIETTYVASNAIFIRLFLMAILYLTSFGLKDLLIPLALFGALLPAGLLGYIRILRPVSEILINGLMMLSFGSLVYFKPIQSIFFFLLLALEILIVFVVSRTLVQPEKRIELGRVLLLLSVPVILCNCV
eukprot:TRINITY_DN3396_c0_g1_i1.p1 TRINITY_DN3396_c0_g1~~TRINITY_DN3396_c0_g1_i1.p1  ORF type:complete len:419 (-),score=-2.45 TRINITY_DN3396_c0_g1_i1:60-1316(-)